MPRTVLEPSSDQAAFLPECGIFASKPRDGELPKLRDLLFRAAFPNNEMQSFWVAALFCPPLGQKLLAVGRGTQNAVGPESGFVGRSLLVPCGNSNNKLAPTLDRDFKQTLSSIPCFFYVTRG